MTTILANVNRVLTNVVVRDKKTGAVIKGLKQSDFQVIEDKKPQKITTFDYQNVDQAVTLAESEPSPAPPRRRRRSIADLVNNDFAADAGGVEGPPPDRDVLRPQQHAAGGHYARGRFGQGLHQQQDGAGGPGRVGQPGLGPQHGPGLHLATRRRC